LAGQKIESEARAACTVMLVSGGYPGDYAKGKPISGLETITESLVFHAGTKSDGNAVLTNGGRVITLTSFGTTHAEALAKSYQSAKQLDFEGIYYRRDIGFDI
jgi:phosphoribosylamine--glycine ligase